MIRTLKKKHFNAKMLGFESEQLIFCDNHLKSKSKEILFKAKGLQKENELASVQTCMWRKQNMAESTAQQNWSQWTLRSYTYGLIILIKTCKETKLLPVDEMNTLFIDYVYLRYMLTKKLRKMRKFMKF